jgi:hypothetical protein
MTVIIFALIFWALPVWVCVAQGKARNRNGWAWGLLLGWLGVLMIFLLPPRKLSPLELEWKQFNENKTPEGR